MAAARSTRSQTDLRIRRVLLDDALTLEPEVPVPLGEANSASFAASHPGQFAVARVGFPGSNARVLVISMYGIWLASSGNGGEAALHRAISDLTPLFLETKAPRIVLAGDLNLFRNTNNSGQRRFDTVFTRLEAYGL